MESEPVLMEIHLSEARLTNGITNDGNIIPAGSRTICHAESSIITNHRWGNAAEHSYEIEHMQFSLDSS